MRRTISILVLAASMVLSCHGDSGPTAPQQQTPQLAGTWSGSVHYKAPVGFYYDEGTCPDQSVTVTINQTGMEINGTIQAACVTAQFQATIGPSLIVAYGTATQTANGATYSATFRLNLVVANGTILRMTGTTAIFTSSTGGQLDSIVLTLGR